MLQIAALFRAVNPTLWGGGTYENYGHLRKCRYLPKISLPVVTVSHDRSFPFSHAVAIMSENQKIVGGWECCFNASGDDRFLCAQLQQCIVGAIVKACSGSHAAPVRTVAQCSSAVWLIWMGSEGEKCGDARGSGMRLNTPASHASGLCDESTGILPG